jgi:hypothetical protein
MKTLLITLAIIEVIQFISLLSCIMTDAMGLTDFNNEKHKKFIQSKRDVLKFFIPFFWFIPMLNMILIWWNKLK